MKLINVKLIMCLCGITTDLWHFCTSSHKLADSIAFLLDWLRQNCL